MKIAFLKIVQSASNRFWVSVRAGNGRGDPRRALTEAGFVPGDDVVVMSREVYNELVAVQAGNAGPAIKTPAPCCCGSMISDGATGWRCAAHGDQP